MKMHFGWKPLILWSLHLYDIYKLFLGKGCPSGQCWMVNVGINFLFKLSAPQSFDWASCCFVKKCLLKTERRGCREFRNDMFPSALALPSL